MKMYFKSLIFALAGALAMTACSNEMEQQLAEGSGNSGQEVKFTVGIENLSRTAIAEGEGVLKTTFVNEDAIGIFAYREGETEPAYKNVKYTYNASKSEWNSEKAITSDGTKLSYYAYYPYMDEVTDPSQLNITVSADQTGGFSKDDVLTAQNTTAEADAPSVTLTFKHAFAMVQVKVKLPVGDNPAEGPFPPEAVQSAYLRSMLRAYEVSYSEVIDNDGRRTVRVSDADDKTEAGSDRRKNVIMRRTVSPVKTDDTEARYQEYLFQAIVPEQSLLNEGKDFLYFNVKRNDGNEGTTLYKFVPNKAEISLKAGHRLNLSLAIDAVTHEVVVLTAILEPWSKAEVGMELVPVKPKTQP